MILLLPLLACRSPSDPPLETDPPLVPTADTSSATTVPTPAGAASSVVLISIDTTRQDHIGAFGSTDGLTPNLDAFAQTSVRYTQARSHAPWTKPSMATVHSSQLPDEHGFTTWEGDLPEGLPTLSTVLDDAGWTTLATVAHYAFVPSMHRFDEGFDTFDQSAFVTRGLPEGFLTSEELTDAALDLLPDPDAGPFLLWVHYFDPHRDYLDHPDQDRGLFDQHRYAEEIVFTDRHLGRLLERLDDYPDTAVVVHADHGEEFGDHGGTGHSTTLYDELIRVPLLIRAPGLTPAEVDVPVGLVDVAPTVLHLVGVDAPDTFRGESLLPTPVARPLFTETRRNASKRGVVHDGWKMVWSPWTADKELYDLVDDPDESVNRLDDALDRAAALESLLLERYPALANEPPFP